METIEDRQKEWDEQMSIYCLYRDGTKIPVKRINSIIWAKLTSDDIRLIAEEVVKKLKEVENGK